MVVEAGTVEAAMLPAVATTIATAAPVTFAAPSTYATQPMVGAAPLPSAEPTAARAAPKEFHARSLAKEFHLPPTTTTAAPVYMTPADAAERASTEPARQVP